MKTIHVSSNYSNVRMAIPVKNECSIRDFELECIDRIVKKEFGKGKEFFRNYELSRGMTKGRKWRKLYNRDNFNPS